MANELEDRRGSLLEPRGVFAEQPILGRILPQEPIGPLESKGGGKKQVQTNKHQEKQIVQTSEKASAAADAAQGQRMG